MVAVEEHVRRQGAYRHRRAAHDGSASAMGSPTCRSPSSPARRKSRSVRACRKKLGRASACSRPSTPARPSSTPRRTTTTRPTTQQDEVRPCDKKKAMIIGAGPNRIGQGIEFDYCCVHASYALHDARATRPSWSTATPRRSRPTTTPPTRLYFEPLTYEDVMDIVDAEQPDGVVVTLGGQTPLKLAQRARGRGRAHHGHAARGHRPGRGPRPLLGAARRARHRLSRRRAWPNTIEEALDVAHEDRLPAARAPELRAGRPRHGASSYDDAVPARATWREAAPRHARPPRLPRQLPRSRATECDVDALCDGEDVYIGAILEHIEEAGIHSGDSACCTPPVLAVSDKMHRHAHRLHAPARARRGHAWSRQHPVRA